MHRLHVGEQNGLLRRLVDRLAERPAAAQAGVVDGAQVGLGMCAASDVVAPRMNAGDAGVQRLDRREPRARIHVLRAHRAGEARDCREETVLALVAGHAAEQRVPHMPVRIDEAGHHDSALRVDHRRARCRHIRADRHDRAIFTCTDPFGMSPSCGSMVMTWHW